MTELRQKQVQRTEITSDYVLFGLKEVAERCLQRVPVMEWDYKAKEMVRKRDEAGNTIWAFDSSGANRSFELLGKHLGVFEKDNRQLQPTTPPMTDEQVNRFIEETRNNATKTL